MSGAALAAPLAGFAIALMAGMTVHWLATVSRVKAEAVATSNRRRRSIGRETDRRARSAGPGRRTHRMLAAIARIVPRLVARAGHRDVRAAIDHAGLTGRITPRDVAAARVLSVGTGLLLAPRIATALPGRALPLVFGLWLIAASELPLWWLRKLAKRRAAAMREALPDALELTRACLMAGLPLRRALLLVGDHCAEPVAGEFLCVAAETTLGIPQATALDGLVARNPLPEIRALVAAMHQAQRHGSPLGPVIAAQADEARRAADRAIIERGAKAGPKIQLLVATTIVPSALLGLAAVVIAAIARGDLQFI